MNRIQLFIWHPYPKETPPKSDTYLISAGRGVPIVYYDVDKDVFQIVCEDTLVHIVPDAWSKLPKAYRGEK